MAKIRSWDISKIAQTLKSGSKGTHDIIFILQFMFGVNIGLETDEFSKTCSLTHIILWINRYSLIFHPWAPSSDSDSQLMVMTS